MTRIGTIAPFAAAVNERIVRRLTDAGALAGARVHPMDLYLALKAYSSGLSQPEPRKPAQTWQPVGPVVDALEHAYELSFGAVRPSGQPLLVAVDSSGSMRRWSKNLRELAQWRGSGAERICRCSPGRLTSGWRSTEWSY
ncbi:MAG: hypothetical protein ACRDOK_11495 [Streptosporangiaceae bacterium]